MKQIKLFFLLLSGILLLSTPEATAEKYVVEDLLEDSVQVYRLTRDAQNKEIIRPAFNLPVGEVVDMTRILDSSQPPYAVVQINGSEYVINAYDLVFSDENPRGTVDRLAEVREEIRYTFIHRFFATMIPYWIIMLLFATAMACIYLGLKHDSMRHLALRAVPAAMLAGCLIEICAVLLLENAAFWWCDPDRYGFFGSLFRVIPFVLVVAFQLYSIKFYMQLITRDSENTLAVKPMLISLGICIPVLIVTALIAQELLHLPSWLCDTLSMIAFFGALTWGIRKSFKTNIEVLGQRNGTLFSLFGIVWAIGAAVAVCGLVMVVAMLIFQLLVALCLGVVLIWYSSYASAPTPEVFFDKKGRQHPTQSAANMANARIDKERQETME